MSKPWIFICPSSRGIGRQLTRHLLQRTTAPILATSRSNPSDAKTALLSGLEENAELSSRLHVVQVDVTDEVTIEAASKRAAELFPLRQHHLHLAFAIPGILHAEKSLRQVDAAKAALTYRVNALGPLLLMKWFGEFLPRRSTEVALGDAGGEADERGKLKLPANAVWLTMSARVGSISDNRSGGWFSYRSSKAAVNSLTKSLDHQLHARSGDNAMAMAYHPGTVRTDLSREFWDSTQKNKLFDPEYGVERMIEVVTGKIGLEGRGRCWDWKGEEVLP